MIYLDNAATTRMSGAVFDAMVPWLREKYGNPGTVYGIGREAQRAVERAREQVASLINAEPDQVIFTSGGSESNSTVFRSLIPYLWNAGKMHVLTSAVEHDSVLNAATELRKSKDIFSSTIPCTEDGTVPPGAVETAITGVEHPHGIDTGLASVMAVNNETGAENDVAAIAEVCKKHDVLFHTDCVQAASCIPLDVKKIGCDFLSLSSHKLHGPKGVGALFVLNKTLILPTVFGGTMQEFGLRGGTENVPGIVGFGAACQLTKETLEASSRHTSVLKQLFMSHLRTELEKLGLGDILHLNCNNLTHPGRIVNLRMDGVDGETLVLMLDAKGVCVSSGSACRSHESEPSRVLVAMGIDPEDARNSVRVSFSVENTEEEAEEAAKIFASCAKAMIDGA